MRADTASRSPRPVRHAAAALPAMRGPMRAALALALCSVQLAQVQGSGAACAPCKSLLGALQRKALDGWAREQLLGACAAQPEAQRSQCVEAAVAVEEQMRAAFAANPPAALCAKAGVCPSSFLADITALLFDAEPSRAAQCAACEGAARNAVAALSDATTQDTLRASAHAACGSLGAPVASQCSAAVDAHFADGVAAAVTHLSDARRACVALEQCSCPMHGALPAVLEAQARAAERAALAGGSAASLLFSSSDDYEDWWHQLWTSTTSSEAFAAFSEIFWSDSSSFSSEDGEAGVRFESVAFVHPRAFGPL